MYEKRKALVLMKTSELFENLSQVEYEKVLSVIEPMYVELEACKNLVVPGDVMNSFVFISKGRLATMRIQPGGDMAIMFEYKPGNFVGFDITNTRTRKAVHLIGATRDCELLTLPADILRRNDIPEDIRAKLNINAVKMLADNNIRRQKKIDILYYRSLRLRILAFMRFKSEMSDDWPILESDMSRDEFAAYIGVNRSALSAELGRMRDEGLITFKKGHFEFLKDDIFKELELYD